MSPHTEGTIAPTDSSVGAVETQYLNLPNPVQTSTHPYVPQNMPAISDLFDMFDFGR